jgi:hypothetical protein
VDDVRVHFGDVLVVVVIFVLVIALVAWDTFGGGRDIRRRIRRSGDEMRRQNEERDGKS